MDVIGTSAERVGGVDRVTGAQQYLADLPIHDVLHVKLVTLDYPTARILSIDTSAAEQVPGVRLIMTAADLPDPMPRYGMQHHDRPIIAIGETKFHGEPVAAVAAETLEAAEEAAGLVRVEYEVLPAISSVAAALDPASPLVQDPAIRKEGPFRHTNTIAEYHFGWGDVDAAAAGADLIVEGTYQWPMQTHFAIEPHGFIAAPDGDGIVVWSTIQHPYQLQRTLARVLGLPLAKVRVIAPDPGGGFGGKQHPKFEPLLAFMALQAQRPVRLILTLAETFQAARRAGAEVTVRAGLQSDGTLVFQDFENNFLLGAYAEAGDRTASKPSYLSAGPYRTPAVRIVSRGLLTHTTPTHPLRGFGIPQLTWAREQILDEAAHRLGMDPLALRMKNLARYREEFIPGDTPADGDWAQTVEEAARLIDWGSPLPEGRGRGMAVAVKSGPTTGLSYARVRRLADGSAVVLFGTSDMGQGARTVFAQIVAEELGIPLDRVSVISGDTAVVPYDQQTSASRSTVLMGNAVMRACDDVNRQIAGMAARIYGVAEEEVAARNGVVRMSNEEIPADEVVAAGLGPLGGEISGVGEMRKDVVPGHPLAGTATFYEFNCTAVEVEVDAATGVTRVLRHVSVGDAGKALNPGQVTGQDDGAAVMGLGHALMEHLILDEAGRVRNLGAVDYRIPTVMDMPGELVTRSIENGDGPGPYGAKGVSEGSLLGTAPAVAAAVRDAVGVVIRDLPLTPERVWTAIQEQQPTR
ncbi:MAG: xanthine dehydrogenase family protein molybdopterin-binding subunit [Actinobacteria bacterium]|nr:xanthine dehydrogenase family protein molybdopterin-binding subunit [Actinomycetota bacterium]MBU1493850.1 xanthine dehydrogenase family protein molybdopterin-binding subunit [Actinomycetota bacterium]